MSESKNYEEVPSTSGDKKMDNKEDLKDVSQEELCYDVNNEEMEDVMSDDLEFQEDSQCDDGNSERTDFSSAQEDFSGDFDKDSLYGLEDINGFLDDTVLFANRSSLWNFSHCRQIS